MGSLMGRAPVNDAPLQGHYFSTRKLPMTKASMPELKKVRTASVGVCTIAPRKLNEVIMITGTPVRSRIHQATASTAG